MPSVSPLAVQLPELPPVAGGEPPPVDDEPPPPHAPDTSMMQPMTMADR